VNLKVLSLGNFNQRSLQVARSITLAGKPTQHLVMFFLY